MDCLAKYGSTSVSRLDPTLSSDVPCRYDLMIWDVCPLWLSASVNSDMYDRVPRLVITDGTRRVVSTWDIQVNISFL